MTRLTFLLAATLAAIFIVLSTFGSGNLRAERQQPPHRQETTQEQPSEAPPDPPADPSNAPAEQSEIPESSGADGEPPADLVQATGQTPERVQEFPGPELQPSPEYADEVPEPAALPDDTQGPILYVTGTRVNFRSGPSTDDRVIGALDGGTAVEALGPTGDDWVHIRDTDGRIGYMSGQFLSPDAP
ncbi:SH3 domain-containing protein [Paracoccus alkanivorans]|uniref:SH3 domain-containing protein n=1 Tax=Paracoccus alkanivorans TaxID=2116655 RepID=A0A3M0MEV1_9RHOB|nr:SH3 domain-containing protein [Paracoccus alkanivorans]RMC36278.1 SH3 domain-containing protein [Paracoccus alkanivorans]